MAAMLSPTTGKAFFCFWGSQSGQIEQGGSDRCPLGEPFLREVPRFPSPPEADSGQGSKGVSPFNFLVPSPAGEGTKG